MEVIRVLLEHGADATAKDKDGSTPMSIFRATKDILGLSHPFRVCWYGRSSGHRQVESIARDIIRGTYGGYS
jgi:hypothetical protein